MELNTKSERQPVLKKKMSSFRKAFLWTAIPIIFFTIIGLPGAIAPFTAWPGFGLFGGIAAGLWVLAILSCMGCAIARKREIARGILAGVGIGFLCVVTYIVIAEYHQPPP